MTPQDTTAEVHVDVTPSAPPETPDDDTTVVVVTDTPTGDIPPSVAEFMARQAAINERLLAAVEHATGVADDALDSATMAENAVDDAVSEVSVIAADVAATVEESRDTPTADDDTDPPNAVHRWYR